MAPENSTALARIEKSTLPIKNLQELQQIGSLLESSGMFGCNAQGQGFVIAATCFQEGITFLDFKRKYYLIQGTPTKRTDAMLAEFEEADGEHELVTRTSEEAHIRLKIGKHTFDSILTWKDASLERFPYEKDGKTLKINWSTPRMRMQMLWARVISDGIRTIAPRINSGTYTPEEVWDFIEGDTKSKAVAVSAEAAASAMKTLFEENKQAAPSASATHQVAKPTPEQQKPAEQPAASDAKPNYGDLGPVPAPASAPQAPAGQQQPAVIDADIVSDSADMTVPAGDLKGKKLTELSDDFLAKIPRIANPLFTAALKSNAERILAERQKLKGGAA